MSIKSEVEAILKKRWEGLRDPNELISQYNIEKQTNQGYNGRQLLELFQNCEDEGANKVRIVLDTENSILKISNNGKKPFSLQGYKSIFYPGLTAKVSSGYIGNKGLGFRSIINWAEEIIIISNDFKVVFNNSFKKDTLINKIGYTERSINDLRKERGLNKDIYPISFLNSCKVIDLDETHEYATTIQIIFKKEFEQDIQNQLKSISEKTLLFLKNIDTIEIVKDGLKEVISVSRKEIEKGKFEIKYNENTYYVLSDEGTVDKELIDDKESSEPKKYSVSIAYNDDLTLTDSLLYNYFKTQIDFQLPFVAHASLELDQNRNHSTESRLNPFVLKKLFDLHLKLIETLKKKFKKSWLPFKCINNDNLKVYGQYEDILISHWSELEIFPTISGEYYNQSQAKNLGKGFPKFIESNNLSLIFGEQIIPSSFNVDEYIECPVNYKEIIERISIDLQFKQRATFVKLICDTFPDEEFCVLIDDKKHQIAINDIVFTDKTTDNADLRIPSYSKIRFLHPQLVDYLYVEFQLQNDSAKSRTLTDKLSQISNIQSFEPQTVIKKIISETNVYLELENINIAETIKIFYQTLFYNYKLRGSNPVLENTSRVPCLNEFNEVCDIKNLVLSDEFEIGKISNKIFNELYEKQSIIIKPVFLGLENERIDEIESFLLWLGINHIFIIESKTTNLSQNYLTYLKTEKKVTVRNFEFLSIKNFDKILIDTSITVNHIIAALSLDEKIFSIFNNFTRKISENEKINNLNFSLKREYQILNYIYFNISWEFQIDNYLITNRKSEWFNPFEIDYTYLKETNSDLDKREVDRILLFFNAKNDFNDLNIEHLREKTNLLASGNDSKGAQVFYKNLVAHYRKNNQVLQDVNLFAKQGNDIVVKKSDQIYFSDRIRLPDILTNKFPILYYPSRAGGMTAIEMFGLNNLSDLDLEILRSVPNNFILDKFESYLKEVKPFILAFRLEKITKEDIKLSQAHRLNNLKIVCCEELECSINGEPFDIDEFNYIYSEEQYFIKIPQNISFESLKTNKVFIDNLSDIFLKVFDTLDEKKTFEAVLKQTKEDNIYDIQNDLADGVLEIAKNLLGENSARLSIWKAIFKVKEIEIEDLNESNLNFNIEKHFINVNFENGFYSSETLKQLGEIREIFFKLSVNLEDYNKVSDQFLSFDKLFNKEILDYYELKKKNLKNQLWSSLRDDDLSQQSKFVQFIDEIENLISDNIFNLNESNYDFDVVIIKELKQKFPNIIFELNNDNFQEYDSIKKLNMEEFTSEENVIIRRDETLNSLIHFEGRIEQIKTKIIEIKNSFVIINSFEFEKNIEPEVVDNFEIYISEPINQNGRKRQVYLGGSDELPNDKKKELGNATEKIVEKYLLSLPNLYQNVEHISQTNEGKHYDFRFYDLQDCRIKYIECKFYDGFSFFLTKDEKRFAFDNLEQFEIWLVDKNARIFIIKDVRELGDIEPANYKVYIKVKEYAQ